MLSTVFHAFLRFKELPLCSIPDSIEGSSQSKDGCHWAFVTSRGNKKSVVIDGSPGPKFDGIQDPDWRIYADGSAERLTTLFSPDGTRWAYAAKTMNKWVMVVDNNISQGFDAIATYVFSGDGNHLAYEAKDGGKWAVVLDNRKGPQYDGLQFNPAFSPDSQHMAYAAKKGERWVVVIDGRESVEYEAIVCGDPVFSPDSKHVAYAAKKDGKWFVVRDGQPGSHHDFIIGRTKSFVLLNTILFSVVYSTDSKHLAYVAMNGRKAVLVVDGVPGREYDDVSMQQPFSPDGKRFAHSAWRAGKCIVVTDGTEGTEYDGIADVGPVFSRDSKHVGYMACKGKNPAVWFVVVDDKPFREHSLVAANKQTFFNCGTCLAYSAMNEEGKWSLFVDGKEGAQYDAIGNFALFGFKGANPFFSPDGRRMAYVATKGQKTFVVVDGSPENEFDAINWFDAIKDRGIIFSPDGKITAYTARTAGKWCAVINGRPGQPYDEIRAGSIVFSHTGGHTAYVAKKGPSWFVILDNRPIGEYSDVICNGPNFRRDNSVEYLAVKNKRLYRVKKSLLEQQK